jgi:2-oxoglutarate ferredoxin oxidoreductase subunit gamma
LIPITSGRDDIDELVIPVNDIALDIGNVRTANIVALSAFVARSNIVEFQILEKAVLDEFTEKKQFIYINMDAVRQGKMAAA